MNIYELVKPGIAIDMKNINESEKVSFRIFFRYQFIRFLNTIFNAIFTIIFIAILVIFFFIISTLLFPHVLK